MRERCTTNLLWNINHQFAAIGISDTWLNFVDIENYNFIHNHRKDQHGGGVGLYLQQNLNYKIRKDLRFDNSETTDSLFVEFIVPKGKMYSNLLCPLINRPTRITSHTATLIDKILTNNTDSDIVNGLFFSDISDHLPIFTICLDNINCSSNNNTYLFRGKSVKNIKKFENMIANADLSTIDKSNDPK